MKRYALTVGTTGALALLHAALGTKSPIYYIPAVAWGTVTAVLIGLHRLDRDIAEASAIVAEYEEKGDPFVGETVPVKSLPPYRPTLLDSFEAAVGDPDLAAYYADDTEGLDPKIAAYYGLDLSNEGLQRALAQWSEPETTSCRSMVHPSLYMTPCPGCGVGPDDECSPDCPVDWREL